MTGREITILQLYPKDMNIYGDYGNVLVIMRRLQWYGYGVNLLTYDVGDKFPDNVDIIVGGGGQDSGQNKIQDDLIRIAPKLKKLAEDGTPMLVICGLYQIFGKFFKTADGIVIRGIGILNIETYGRAERLIGNIVTISKDFGEIVGYENHSGQTYLDSDVEPLGTIRVGAGNNLESDSEGARYKNVIGSYMHGSLLPKNPKIADFLIEQAITRKYGVFYSEPISDCYTLEARAVAMRRPR